MPRRCAKQCNQKRSAFFRVRNSSRENLLREEIATGPFFERRCLSGEVLPVGRAAAAPNCASWPKCTIMSRTALAKPADAVERWSAGPPAQCRNSRRWCERDFRPSRTRRVRLAPEDALEQTVERRIAGAALKMRLNCTRRRLAVALERACKPSAPIEPPDHPLATLTALLCCRWRGRAYERGARREPNTAHCRRRETGRRRRR